MPINEDKMKRKTIKILKSIPLISRMYNILKRYVFRVSVVDYEFPELINIETASICNLQCIHCPSHSKVKRDGIRKFGQMSYGAFERIMDQIDGNGNRMISLHKDGEPLLNKDICKILERVKANRGHYVYLTTNGLLLNDEIIEAIINNKIDRVNISIGANSKVAYKEIRGGDIDVVKNNVEKLIDRCRKSHSALKISVQIIKLNHYKMNNEILAFKKYWSTRPVEIEIWDELSWGIGDGQKSYLFRYPCYSLWNSISINHDGLVSACCMDWNQSLIIGDTRSQSIREIWGNENLMKLRKCHMNNNYSQLDLCSKCNYWKWQPRLKKYNAMA
jgi:radical SAM protein with 4Fe4S-binding SPASM domain